VSNGIGCTQQSSSHRQALTATRAHPRKDTPGVSSERSPKFGPKEQLPLGWPELLLRALSVKRGRAVDGFWPTPRGPGECRGARGGENIRGEAPYCFAISQAIPNFRNQPGMFSSGTQTPRQAEEAHTYVEVADECHAANNPQ
jgi:hypothetical protein